MRGLPADLPAVFAGALFAFTLSLDELIITLFRIGGHDTLPIYVHTQVKFGITPEVDALARRFRVRARERSPAR